MAQKKQQQGRGNQNNSGRAGNVGENIAKSDGGRERKRKHAQNVEDVRNKERKDGTFHLRVNANKSNDLKAALNGVCGSYAYPGGNKPSIHFTVAREAGRGVFYWESTGKGHELASCVVPDPTVYIPCHYVTRYGENFSSRLSNKVAKATQEFLCRYLAREYSLNFDDGDTGEDTADDLIERANHNMADLFAGKPGLYYKKATGEGEVVLEVFINKNSKPSVRVVESTVPNLVASRAFIPVHLLHRDTIERVTDEDTYALQVMLFSFLKVEPPELLLPLPIAVTVEQPTEKKMGKKEQAKLARRQAEEKARTAEEEDSKAKLEAMRKQALRMSRIASGAIGYADMSNLSGDLIVLFGKDGADHVATVAYIAAKHMLRLVGVEGGTRVYGGQILNGHVDRLDHGADKLSADKVKALNALIGYIRDRFTEDNIRIPERKKANLARVA